MFKSQMIEKEKDFICQNKHNQLVNLVVLDPKLEKKQRLLCSLCLENFESNFKTIGLKKIIQVIQDKQESQMSNLENVIQETIQQLQQCVTSSQQLKSQYNKLFDSIISIAQDWRENLDLQRQQFYEYSFQDELDNYIKNLNVGELANMQLINNINQSWMTKLDNLLNQHNQEKVELNINELKLQIMNSINQKQSQKDVVKFKLIDQSIKQPVKCSAIVFDSLGSIMVSTEEENIKVWRFINGTIKLINTLQGHPKQILCLIYSKKQNSFISGCLDFQLRCWKQMNLNEWSSSQPYLQHTGSVRCVIMNQNEDLLFSGSRDKSIKVWKIDFNYNELTYLYSLEKHNNKVMALSLNSSENILVSCADDKEQIIIWERQSQGIFQFKYHVIQSIYEYGQKVKFINENQFIWVSGCQNIDKLYVFELKEGKFQENQEKTVQLNKNNLNVDEYLFPIVYNQELNLIVVRHKTYIYLIRIMNDGKFKIVDQLDCKIYEIYGTVTNDWKYLVYWDEQNQGYSIYEL